MHRSNKHFKTAGLSDTMKTQVELWVRVFCREHVFRVVFLSVRLDDPTRMFKCVEQIHRRNDQWPLVLEFKIQWRPDDPTPQLRKGRMNRLDEWRQQKLQRVTITGRWQWDRMIRRPGQWTCQIIRRLHRKSSNGYSTANLSWWPT